MILDDVNNKYNRYIELYKNIENEKDHELAFQKLCYIIYKMRELCTEIDDFSSDLCMNKNNSLTKEQKVFFEDMVYTENIIKKLLKD